MDAFGMMNRLGNESRPFLFVADFELRQPFVIPLNEVDPAEILYDAEGIGNAPEAAAPARPASLSVIKTVGRRCYHQAYERVQQSLHAGDTYLLNLTFGTKIRTCISLRDMFFVGNPRYRLWLKDRFVCFSPETFVKIRNGRIYSYPMKGTISCSIPGAEQKLLGSAKETAEHYTIVDLIRNDLSMVSTDVRVERFRYVDKVRTRGGDILQVSSEISGRLPSSYARDIGSIIRTLLPAGSVSGAPKIKTVEIIEEAETEPRGYYTGVFGIFDGSNLNSAVLIRYVEQRPDGLWFRSGGGITLMSNEEDEYRELLDKVYLPG